jgi:outer membrane protein TolC
MEKEPDQSIIRLGISVALPLHHDRSQERTLAKLKIQQMKLDNAQLSLDIRSQKKMLAASINELSVQYHTLQILQKEQQGLTTLLKEGYEIAQGSLFELMNEKNRLLQTQKALLQTQKMINDQKTELRFLQGNYND